MKYGYKISLSWITTENNAKVTLEVLALKIFVERVISPARTTFCLNRK